jgi:hypothetical protein
MWEKADDARAATRREEFSGSFVDFLLGRGIRYRK